MQYSNVPTLKSANNLIPFITQKTINGRNYSNQHHLYFTIKNNNNFIDSTYFFIGHWINFKANKIKGNYYFTQSIDNIPLNVINNRIPVLKILLQPNDSATYEIIPDIRNFNFNYIHPYLVNQNALEDFGYTYYLRNQKWYLAITFIFIGILFTMFLYAAISWAREKTKEYFHYGVYVLFFMIYFFIRVYTMFQTSYTLLNYNYIGIHFTQVVGYIFYTFFLISFLNLKQENIILYSILKWFNIVMMTYLILDIYLIHFSNLIYISITLFTLIRYFILTTSIIVVFFLFRKKMKLYNYIAWGLLMLFILGLISLFFSTLNIRNAHFVNFFDMRIPLYQAGIATELILFTMALQHKTNIRNKDSIIEMETLKVENEKKEFESYMLVLKTKDVERTRIAQEIHDDIGSGLTNIRLLSEIAKEKNKDAPLHEITKISNSASELIENMNEIIWSINSKNDYLANLIAYLRSYVVTYFENMESILVRTNIAKVIPNVEITGEYRRAVFLTIKESLHNIIKHANATEVNLKIEIDKKTVLIQISDNGVGIIKTNTNPFSNGLKNMIERMESLGGKFNITGVDGTIVTLLLPF